MINGRKYLIALCLIAISTWTSLQAQASAVEEFKVNGLQVILKHNTANQIISAQLYVRGGVLNVAEETQGIEALMFNCALHGSKKYDKEAINRILDRTSAQITPSANRNYSSVALRCIKRNFDETWNVFADVIMHPTFPDEEVELVRNQLLDGIRQRHDDPDAYLDEIADELFYTNHPYQLNPQGTEESVASLSISQMKGYLQQHLVTSKLLLVVIGNVSKAELRQKVEQTFGKLPKGNYQPLYPEWVKHSTGKVKVVQRELPTNYIQGYFSAPSSNHPDYYPMVIAMNILRSRVWEEVRTKRNLSYAPSAFYSNEFANRAAIYVTAVDPDTTIKVMLAELNKLKHEPVTTKDLQDRVTMYLTRYYLNNETSAAQGQFLAYWELCGRGWSAGQQFVDQLREVTVADVQRVANLYFHNLQFAVLGNPDLIDEQLFTVM